MLQEKKQRGGARPGAGRKKDKERVQICFRIESDLLYKIKDCNKNKFVNDAIREKLERMETIIKDAEEIETL